VPMTGAVLDKVVFAKVNNILSQSVESVSSSCGC
jgi:hypothetical protein